MTRNRGRAGFDVGGTEARCAGESIEGWWPASCCSVICVLGTAGAFLTRPDAGQPDPLTAGRRRASRPMTTAPSDSAIAARWRSCGSGRPARARRGSAGPAAAAHVPQRPARSSRLVPDHQGADGSLARPPAEARRRCGVSVRWSGPTGSSGRRVRSTVQLGIDVSSTGTWARSYEGMGRGGCLAEPARGGRRASPYDAGQPDRAGVDDAGLPAWDRSWPSVCGRACDRPWSASSGSMSHVRAKRGESVAAPLLGRTAQGRASAQGRHSRVDSRRRSAGRLRRCASSTPRRRRGAGPMELRHGSVRSLGRQRRPPGCRASGRSVGAPTRRNARDLRDHLTRVPGTRRCTP